jgi:hypothetical protein
VEEQIDLTVPAVQMVAKIAKQVNIFSFILEFRPNFWRRGQWRRFLKLSKTAAWFSVRKDYPFELFRLFERRRGKRTRGAAPPRFE